MGVELNIYGTKGARVWQDSDARHKVYGAIGEGARSWALRPGLPCDNTTFLPDEFIHTVTGTSPVTRGVAAGYPLLASTGAAADWNGLNMQMAGETAVLGAGKQIWLRGKIKVSVDVLSDILFGLCELKTDLLQTSAAHAVTATNVAGVFFHKASHVSDKTIHFRVYVSGALISSVAVGTLTTDDIDYAIWFDGSKVRAYINDAEVASFAGSLPAGELTPSFNLRTGAAAAVTASFAEMAYVSIE